MTRPEHAAEPDRTPPHSEPPRVDLLTIVKMVDSGSRVLDIGCGDGTLLQLLARKKQVDGRGIEIDQANVARCMAKGLSVIQGDAETELRDYPDKSFDYAILSQTLQTTRKPHRMLEELLRIAGRVIVSFPNFGHWSIRLKFLLGGQMPVSRILPYKWYETPNIHICSIRDFEDLCDELDIKIIRSEVLNWYGRELRYTIPLYLQNTFGEQAVFMLEKKSQAE